jgi:hypothetical protein
MAKQPVVNAEYPYLSNVKAPPQLLGLAPLMNPFSDHISAQRLMMFSSHLQQAQVTNGAEFPQIFSGYESIVGKYEFDPSARDQDVQVVAVIPKFIKGTEPGAIHYNPYHTVVYRETGPGDPSTKKIGYFQYTADCMRSDGYGYKFQKMNQQMLNVGNLIPKEAKFLTSPAHHGEKYGLGVNLNAVYLDIPEITEDAFVISESAAKKLGSVGYGTKTFKILPTQIPVGLYSDENEYKFMPDIGDKVRDDGILCALRTPTESSVVFDTLPQNLTKVQHLHDKVFYAPAGAEIVDIDVIVNRKCRVKSPRYLFSQVEKYKQPANEYCQKVWQTYQQALKEGKKLTPEFRALVTRCLAMLLIDDQDVPGLNKKLKLSAYKQKEQIEFIYITVTYCYPKPMKRGHKATNRSKLFAR